MEGVIIVLTRPKNRVSADDANLEDILQGGTQNIPRQVCSLEQVFVGTDACCLLATCRKKNEFLFLSKHDVVLKGGEQL